MTIATNVPFQALRPGGRFRPKSQHKVAIVIPYRNRTEQLRTFLNCLHPILQRQDLDYGIFVVDQVSVFIVADQFNQFHFQAINISSSLGW